MKTLGSAKARACPDLLFPTAEQSEPGQSCLLMGVLQQKNCRGAGPGRAQAGPLTPVALGQRDRDENVDLSLVSDLDLYRPSWAPGAGAVTGHIKAEDKMVCSCIPFGRFWGQGKARPVFSSEEIDTICSLFSLAKKGREGGRKEVVLNFFFDEI